MATKSVLGDTRVSPTLIQTSEARESSSLILWECVIIAAIIGSASGSFWTVGLLTFMLLFALVDTMVWIYISYAVSILVAYLFASTAFEVSKGSIFSAVVFGFFGYFLMLSWHHWGLAYWRSFSK